MSRVQSVGRIVGTAVGVHFFLGLAGCDVAPPEASTVETSGGDGVTSTGGVTGGSTQQTVAGSTAGGTATGGRTTTGGAGTASGGLTASTGNTGSVSTSSSTGTTSGTNTTTGGFTNSTGGGSTSSTGFTSSTGGTTSSTGSTTGSTTGGTTGGSNCTDIPPNNGDTCAHAVQYGWCTQSWLADSCQKSCGKCSGSTGSSGTTSSSTTGGSSTSGSTSSGNTTSGGSTGAMQPPPITGGSNGWASRYWDCCKPACGWKANVRSGNPMQSCNKDGSSMGGNYDAANACGGGNAYMCWSGSPWSVSDTLSYGFAAASAGNYVCGRCYQLQFSGTGHNGNNPGAVSLNGKTMIVQVINNGGVAADQFDLLIPGGGVGALNACDSQWGTSDLGAQYGGFLAGCNGDTNCVKQKCMTVFAGKADLQAGCDWFLNWFNAADNPNFTFKQIACPSGITQKSGMSDPG